MDTNNNYNGDYTNYYQQSEPNNKKPKRKKGTGKKILAGAAIGLAFGVFSAVGFIGANYATKAINGFMENKGITFQISGVNDNNDSKKAEKEENGILDSITDAIKDKEGESGKESAKIEDVAPPEENIGNSIAQSSGVAENDAKINYYDDDQVIATDVTKVVQENMPCLVSVSNKYIATMNYFGQTYSQEAEGAGSGIIAGQSDSELLVITNSHVIEKAKELSVTFVDESTAPAQVKGYDEERDIAVIAVQLDDIPQATRREIKIAQLGDSNDLTVGEPVIAIGNALGYGQSVTTGVVSALNRPIGATSSGGRTTDATFIQTDAAINPGNSGGALLNIRGQVIGINSNKIGGSTVEGMGYAIPISDVLPDLKELMSKQTKLKVQDEQRGYLGITGIDVEQQYSVMYGMPIGVYVSSVSEGSGADAAGLVRGDIIVEINGDEVTCMADLKGQLEYYSAGTTVELTVMQGSPTGYQSKKVSVTLGSSAS